MPPALSRHFRRWGEECPPPREGSWVAGTVAVVTALQQDLNLANTGIGDAAHETKFQTRK